MTPNGIFFTKTIEKLTNANQTILWEKIGGILAQAYINNNKIYTFGTGHSHMLGEELYVRSGGWNYIVPMLLDELTLSSHPWKSTYIERVSGYADVLLALYPVKSGDVIIITSNSGRNGLIVEMALRAKQLGAFVIGVTSLQHANSITSRHDSHQLLKDIANLVIDNQSEAGDTIVSIGDQQCGSTSTIINVFVAHQMVLATFTHLAKKGVKFTTFLSSNLDNQDARNEKLL